jgi:nucleoside-triphosphatase THEP1
VGVHLVGGRQRLRDARTMSADVRTWRRAAVYGSLWASVEIVAGSFLHNLRIPFAGSLLAAFGVLLMTAARRSRAGRGVAGGDNGLIWRAALVCALMKSVSPSAVILGPMVGILMEGVLLEAMVRLARGRAIGYLAGGALAVSWSMVQRVLNALIAFGPDVVRLYVDAYKYAARSLGVSAVGPFDLVAVLVALEMAAGCAAAATGLRIARSAAPGNAGPDLVTVAGSGRTRTVFPGPPTAVEGRWSLWRLAAAVIALSAGMAAIASLPLWAGFACLAAFAGWILRTYPRAAVRLRRPSLWIELAAVMVLAGLLLGGLRQGTQGLLEGAAAGARMTARALMVLLGFTAVSVELRNPVILAWLERRRLRGLSDALGIAFGTLPAFTATLSEHRALWRRPSRLVVLLLSAAETLVEGPPVGRRSRPVAVLTGATGSGKTTLAGAVVEQLRDRGARVAGILAPGMLENGRRTGFDLVNLATGERAPLARETHAPPGAHARWSRFGFLPEGLNLGERALGADARGADVVVVDEVGPFELSGGGWADSLDRLGNMPCALVLVARESVADEVNVRWGSANAVFYRPGASIETLVEGLLTARASV